MDINQRNSIALNQEQIKLRNIVQDQQTAIARMQSELINLRNEMNAIRAIAVSNIGRGSTSGDIN